MRTMQKHDEKESKDKKDLPGRVEPTTQEMDPREGGKQAGAEER